jgi:benzoate-CoA ligase
MPSVGKGVRPAETRNAEMDFAIPDRLNAATLFVDGNVRAGRGQQVAVIDANQGTHATYADVLAAVNRTGNALLARGVRQEERVMILLPDCPEFVFTFFGAMKIGAVPVPVNTLLTPPEYAYLLNDCRARVLVVSREQRPAIDAVRSDVRHLEHVLEVGAASAGHDGLHAALAQGSRELTPADTSKDDAALWLYSSGTTGFPKGTVHLHHDLLVCAAATGRGVLALTATDRTFSVARLFFAYGLGNALYFPFSVGASTILWRGKPDPATCFDIVSRYRPTVFYGVPTAYAAMLTVIDAGTPVDMSSVRLCSSAGEPLAASLYERWKARFGIDILDGIGSTEMLHTFISNRPGRVRPGSSGELVPGYEARIVGGDGADLPAGEVGDLLVKGDSAFAYYWNRHEQTKATIQGEWIRTGDKYSRDADGYFWYKGRSDDMLKAGGYWVSPAEVESTLAAHPAVLECGVVGREDDERLVKPVAFVVLRPGHSGDRALVEELQAFVKARLAPYKFPRWIEFVPDLPRTATGKLQRYKLRELANPHRSSASV